jgi:hypothetical protein
MLKIFNDHGKKSTDVGSSGSVGLGVGRFITPPPQATTTTLFCTP